MINSIHSENNSIQRCKSGRANLLAYIMIHNDPSRRLRQAHSNQTYMGEFSSVSGYDHRVYDGPVSGRHHKQASEPRSSTIQGHHPGPVHGHVLKFNTKVIVRMEMDFRKLFVGQIHC